MSDKTLYTLIVHSENIAGLLNQITAVFTRRQINIESLNVSASSIKGVHKYTITAWTDKDTIEKVVKQIEKKIDVLQAHYFTDDEIYFHEIALYKVSSPEFQANPEASRIIRRYNARIVEVNPVFAIVEKKLLGYRRCFQKLDGTFRPPEPKLETDVPQSGNGPGVQAAEGELPDLNEISDSGKSSYEYDGQRGWPVETAINGDGRCA